MKMDCPTSTNKIFPEVGEDVHCTIPTKRFRLQAVYGHSLIINRSLGDVGVLSANSIWSQFFTGTPLKSYASMENLG